MINSPVITNIVTRPGLSTNPAAAGMDRPDETLLVGVVLDGRRIAWGKCTPRPRTPFGTAEQRYPGPFLAADAEKAIQTHIAPLLVGKPATHFRPLVATLDNLTETVSITANPAVENPIPDKEKVVYSRRALFTGGSGKTQASPRPEPQPEQLTRPLHPALRQGVSQALLAAAAQAQNGNLIEVLVAEYGLEPAGAPLPIQVSIRKGQSLALYPQVGALVYSAGGTDPENELGAVTEKLQGFVRLLSERVAPALSEPPRLVLDVQGGLGRLYGNEPAGIGKILGALYGLERAAKPCALTVQDPVLLDDPAGQAAALRAIKDYVQMRRMSVQIAAGETMHDREHLHLCLEAEAVDGVALHLSTLGTLDRAIRAAQSCREHGVAVTLAGDPPDLLAAVALALNPNFVAAAPDLPAGPAVAALHEEMLRLTTL